MKRLRRTVLLALLLATKSHADIDVKVSGRVHIGAEVEKFQNGNSRYDAKLNVETDRKHGLEGRLALRADNDQEIFLQDVYIDKKYDESLWRFELGKYKKRLGLEWGVRERYRLSIRRTFIYQQLEIFGYAGRETILRLRRDNDEISQYSITFAYNESTDSSMVVHGQTSLSENFHIGNWTLLQWDKIDEKRQLVWANVLSLWLYNRTGSRFELEAFAGVDPSESEFERAFGDGEDVYFYAAKLQYALGFDLGGQDILQPFAHVAYYVYDADRAEFNTVESILGTNYYMGQFQLAFEVALIGTNSAVEPSERNYDDSEVRLEATVYF